MLYFLLLGTFVAFPEQRDALLLPNLKNLKIDASGSLGLYYGGKCHQTFPNETVSQNKDLDWCSNIAENDNSKPWISYSIKNQKLRVRAFSIRNGCCVYDCCCLDDSRLIDLCCCRLYSFSLQGSNDNKTWKTIHKVEKQRDIFYCEYKTYDFPLTEGFTFIRLIQDERMPGCSFCMQVNQIELYGELSASFQDEMNEDNDESVSIIGKLKKGNEE